MSVRMSRASLRERFQSPYITCSFSISKFEDEEVGFVTRRITVNASSNMPVLESTNRFKPHTPQAPSALPQRYCDLTNTTPAPLDNDRRIEAHGGLYLRWWGKGRARRRKCPRMPGWRRKLSHGVSLQMGKSAPFATYIKRFGLTSEGDMGYMLWCHHNP
jgi:hypothetical protein